MANDGLNRVIGYLRRAAGPSGASTLDYPLLLKRFVERGDRAAFEELVWRHSALVLQVCRRHLRNHHDIEDAFQATFLVLVRRAGSIRKGQSIGSWLYKVAYRVALRTRQAAARRANVETSLCSRRLLETGAQVDVADLKLALSEELDRLREKYRLPLVLCYLEGLTTAQAAKQLGCPQGTIHSRLSAAREQLRKRLSHRGFTLPTAGLATLFCATADAAVPARLVAATIRTAVLSQSGNALVGRAASQVTALAEGVLKSMSMTKLCRAGTVLIALCAVSLGLGQIAPVVFGDKPSAKASLVPGSTNTIEVLPKTQAVLGIQIGLIKARDQAPPVRLKMIGALKYDNDFLVVIQPRFPGELAEVRLVTDTDHLKLLRNRPLRVGDKVKQGDVLAVIWSQQFGAAKAALVDTVRAVRLSKDAQARFNQLNQQGSIPYATLKAGEKQLEKDMNALRTAERSLLMWKLTAKEIDDIKSEANKLIDEKKKPDLKDEAIWARLKVRVPMFDKADPDRQMVVVEKNANVGDILVPGKSPPLFKLADISRLQICVHPPEEYVPFLRDAFQTKGGLQWDIRLQSEPPNTPPVKLKVRALVSSASKQPPELMGYLPNRESKYSVGQVITATVSIPSAPRELALPASALVEEGGKAYVLMQPDPKKYEFTLRSVSIIRRDRDVAHISTEAQPAKGVQALRPGERVVTAGAVELKAILDDLLAAD